MTFLGRLWQRDIRLSAYLVALLLLLGGCGGGESNDESLSQPVAADNRTEVASAVIGPKGGSLEVTDPHNPAFGTRIVVPEGALEQTVQIGISIADDPASLPKTYTIAGSSIVFSPAGLTFLKPIILTIPYNDKNNDGYLDGTYISEKSIGALYVETAVSKWEVFQVTNRDPSKNLVTISTNHFSTYLSYVETGMTPAPTPSPTPAPTTQYVAGEHFLANPMYSYDRSGVATIIRQKTPYNYLGVHRKFKGVLAAKLDSHLTMTETGFPCDLAADFASCTFDAAEFYTKIKNSGDAALWDWNCEFVSEYTVLRNYEVRDDTLDGVSAAGIYCAISAVDANSVRVSWTIDASTEVRYASDFLAIRLWANYR